VVLIILGFPFSKVARNAHKASVSGLLPSPTSAVKTCLKYSKISLLWLIIHTMLAHGNIKVCLEGGGGGLEGLEPLTFR